MLPFISRHLICPVHERLLNPPTFRCLRELERSQSASPNDLKTLQQTKLRRLLQHAGAHTPFYRERFRKAGIDVNVDDPFEMLRCLPLLDKDDIRAASPFSRSTHKPGVAL